MFRTHYVSFFPSELRYPCFNCVSSSFSLDLESGSGTVASTRISGEKWDQPSSADGRCCSSHGSHLHILAGDLALQGAKLYLCKATIQILHGCISKDFFDNALLAFLLANIAYSKRERWVKIRAAWSKHDVLCVIFLLPREIYVIWSNTLCYTITYNKIQLTMECSNTFY